MKDSYEVWEDGTDWHTANDIVVEFRKSRHL